MKIISLRSVILIVILFSSFQSFGHPEKKDCGESCFNTEIEKITALDGGCYRYQMLVTAASCAHALSHFALAVPCGKLSSISNSENWKIEMGTDPTTGISGFKVDDIENFGDDGQAGSFTVEFTVCSESDDCNLSCWAPKVAYKASTCVYIQETTFTCDPLSAHLDVKHVFCNGYRTGSALAVVDGGTPPYSYNWSNGDLDSLNTGLAAGSYTVLITDAAGDSLELTAVIEQPTPLAVAVDQTFPSCGVDNGTIDIAISGGTPPYTYEWAHGDTSLHLRNLRAGYYELWIRDSVSCSALVSLQLDEQTRIDVTAEVQSTDCSSNTGSIALNVAGGLEPYTYTWSNGANTSAVTGLGAGVYSVEVSDAQGCSARRSFVVKENNTLKLSASSVKTSCVEDNSGSIDLIVTGGTSPYTYSWTNGETTEDIQGLAQGYYTVTVTDAAGCDASLRVSITSETFQVSSKTQDPSCHGATDGYVEVTPIGGTAPYTYIWGDGSTGNSISNVGGGLHEVTVTDATGCSRTVYPYLTDPAVMTADAGVSNPDCTEGLFTLDVTTSGGTGPYTYNWSDGATTASRDSLYTGDYTVTITDANGCQISQTFTVNATVVNCIVLKDPPLKSDDPEVGDETPVDGGSGDDGSPDSDDGEETDDPDEDLPEGICYNPFSTDIELVEVNGLCYTYAAKVSYDGHHVHGLSHFTVAVSCGTVQDVTNSNHWKIEEGKDPRTGLTGFKVDDISDFGEGALSEEFIVNFTVCAEDLACFEELSGLEYTVAYKYGQCVNYEVIQVVSQEEPTVLAYPNPFNNVTTIEYTGTSDGYSTVEVFNQRGVMVKQLHKGTMRKGVKYSFKFDGTQLANDVYTYKITSPDGVYYGKLILAKY